MADLELVCLRGYGVLRACALDNGSPLDGCAFCFLSRGISDGVGRSSRNDDQSVSLVLADVRRSRGDTYQEAGFAPEKEAVAGVGTFSSDCAGYTSWYGSFKPGGLLYYPDNRRDPACFRGRQYNSKRRRCCKGIAASGWALSISFVRIGNCRHWNACRTCARRVRCLCSVRNIPLARQPRAKSQGSSRILQCPLYSYDHRCIAKFLRHEPDSGTVFVCRRQWDCRRPVDVHGYATVIQKRDR